MFERLWLLSLIILFMVSPVAVSQTLDGGTYDPKKDADIDMFLASWKDSMPRHTHGSLIERDILTQGDQLNPPRKGAVLEYVSKFAHATLFAHNSTVPVTLKGEKEIFYIISGKGVVNWEYIGQTKGRGRNDQENKCGLAVKDIYLYRLQSTAREILCDGS